MKRFDLLGVPGVGKTTTYNLLRQCRNNPNEFLLFEEAYRSVILSKSSPLVQFAFNFESLIPKKRYSIRFVNILNKWLDDKLRSKTSRVENDNLFQAIYDLGDNYPDFLSLTLNGIGKQSLTESNIHPSDYFGFLIVIATRLNRYDLLQRLLGEKTTVVFDSSFTHKVFSIVDFSQKINPDLITRYIRSMPQPNGVIILHALQDVIVGRIRHRAKEGKVSAWHSPIVDTPLLEEWVDKACEVIQYTRTSLEDNSVPVIELDAEKQPSTIAQRAVEFILDNKIFRNY
ncbi:hypothetical protein ACFLV7_08725 [Chloroflexota bacterium]